MSIATMEDLTALDVGTDVRVSNRRWVVAEDNRLERENISIPMYTLTGQVAAGSVALGPRYEVGDWYSRSEHSYYIVRETPLQDGCVDVAGFAVYNGNGYAGTVSYRPDSVDLGTRIAEPEPWMQVAASVLRMQSEEMRDATLNLRSEVDTLTARLARQQATAQSVSDRHDRLRTMLSEWADENPDDVDSGLRDIFEEHDIEFGREEITVTVDISGTTEVDFEDILGHSGVEETIQSGRMADWTSSSETVAELSWSASFEREVEVSRGNCGCEDVDRTVVREWLDANDFHWSGFEYETNCPNC